MHRTPIWVLWKYLCIVLILLFCPQIPQICSLGSSTILPATQVSNLVLHPGIFLLSCPTSNQSLGHVESPTFYFLSHPLLFILFSPVIFQAPITVLWTINIGCLSGWLASNRSFLSIHLLLYSTAVLMLLPIFRYSLPLNLPVASLARLMSKLFSRLQSSLWQTRLLSMKQTCLLLKGPLGAPI